MSPSFPSRHPAQIIVSTTISGIISIAGSPAVGAALVLSEVGQSIFTTLLSDTIAKAIKGVGQSKDLPEITAIAIYNSLEDIKKEWGSKGPETLGAVNIITDLQKSFRGGKILANGEAGEAQQYLEQLSNRSTTEVAQSALDALEEEIKIWEANEGAAFGIFFRQKYGPLVRQHFVNEISRDSSSYAFKKFSLLSRDGDHDIFKEIKAKQDEIKQEIIKLRKELAKGRFENPAHNLNNIPPFTLKNVIGREQDLNDLRTKLDNNCTVAVVNGMGGIGKTTLVATYTHNNIKNYKHMAWLSQTIPGDAESAFMDGSLWTTFGLDQRTVPAEARLETILHAMRSLDDGPNLLVIDNADKALEAFADQLPGPPHWHVLITSREKIGDFEQLPLDFLKPNKAVLLFKEHCKSIKDEALIQRLAETVEYHTLAVELLAKAAEENDHSPEQLMQAIENDLKVNARTHHSKTEVERITSYIHSIFNLDKLSENERWLMKRFALLPPEFHSYDNLCTLFDKDTLEWGEDLLHTLKNLYRRGWLLKEEDNSFRMHRLINEVVKNTYEISFSEVEGMVGRIAYLLQIEREKSHSLQLSWLPYGETIASHFNQEDENTLAYMLSCMGSMFNALGEYDKGIEVFEKTLKILKAISGDKIHPNMAKVIGNIGSSWNSKGHYDKSIEYYEEALKIGLNSKNEEKLNIATRYNNLGEAWRAKGFYDKAIEYFNKSMQLLMSTYGEVHPFVAACNSNIGEALRDKKQPEKAIKHFEKALEIGKEVHGEIHPQMAIFNNNMGAAQAAIDQDDKALEYYEKALNIGLQVHGENHPQTAYYFNNLGATWERKDEPQKAFEYYFKALEIGLQAPEERLPIVAIGYNNIGTFYARLLYLDEACEYLETAVILYGKFLDESHPQFQIALKSLANVREALNSQNNPSSPPPPEE